MDTIAGSFARGPSVDPLLGKDQGETLQAQEGAKSAVEFGKRRMAQDHFRSANSSDESAASESDDDAETGDSEASAGASAGSQTGGASEAINRIVAKSRSKMSNAVPPNVSAAVSTAASSSLVAAASVADSAQPPGVPLSESPRAARPARIRARSRRNAMMPDTMTAKLCEQAAARHELKRKAEEQGVDVDEEDLSLCGITGAMGKAGKRDDDDESDDGMRTFSKKRRKRVGT